MAATTSTRTGWASPRTTIASSAPRCLEGEERRDSQGPTDQTIADFWRMVWQTKSRSVVMLCDIVEQGKKKCEPYWPANKDEVVRTVA